MPLGAVEAGRRKRETGQRKPRSSPAVGKQNSAGSVLSQLRVIPNSCGHSGIHAHLPVSIIITVFIIIVINAATLSYQP